MKNNSFLTLTKTFIAYSYLVLGAAAPPRGGAHEVLGHQNMTWHAEPSVCELSQNYRDFVNAVILPGADNSINERVYIADRGHGRIVIVTIPKFLPDPMWTSNVKPNLISGNTEAALNDFSATTVDAYRKEFANIGSTFVSQYVGEIGNLTPAYIDSDEAIYSFTSTMDNTLFTFFVTFVRENGQWKIRTF